MDAKTLRHRATRLALASTLLLSLSSCTIAPPSSSTAKEAGIFSKDIHVCFDNNSGNAVILDWTSGVSTNSGSGTLDDGQSFCGEGPDPLVRLTFSDSFATQVVVANPSIGQPGVSFHSVAQHQVQYCDGDVCRSVMESDIYADATYAEGESVGSDVEGHHFSVTRDANNDWVNFTATIID